MVLFFQLKLEGQNQVQVFNPMCEHSVALPSTILKEKKVKLKVESLTRTTFRLSPIWAVASTTKVCLRFGAGKPYWRGSISTVDLLVLTSLDQLLWELKLNFPFYKTTYLNEEVNCTEPSPSVRVPCLGLGRLEYPARVEQVPIVCYVSDEEKEFYIINTRSWNW